MDGLKEQVRSCRDLPMLQPQPPVMEQQLLDVPQHVQLCGAGAPSITPNPLGSLGGES